MFGKGGLGGLMKQAQQMRLMMPFAVRKRYKKRKWQV